MLSLAALALVGGGLALQWGLSSSGLVVRGRLGGEPPLSLVRGDSPVRKLAIQTSTRSALTLRGAGALEVGVPPGVEYVRFSLARNGKGSAGVRVVTAGPDGGRTELGRIELAAGEAKWADFELPMKAAAKSLTLEPFGATAESDEIHVGSLLFLGPRPEGAKCGGQVCPDTLPNIVIVSLDTLGARMLGREASGRAISPYLDRLLTQGASFDQAFVHYPNTIASHASLFTGLYPRHHQVYGGLRSTLRSKTLAENLAASGYLTAAFTEDAYVGSAFGFDRGFDSYDDGDHEAALAFGGDAAVTFLRTREWLANRTVTDAPVFLFVHTYEVHAPYIPRDDEAWEVTRSLAPGYGGLYSKGFHHPLDEFAHNSGTKTMPAETVEYLKALHLGEIQYLDRKVTGLFSILEKHLPLRSTLVIVTSDHGEEFGEAGRLGHGETLTDNVLHVPLVFLWPGTISARSAETPVASIDIAPTILETVGLPALEGVDGHSFARYLLGEEKRVVERPIVAELATAFGECYRAGLPENCECDRVAVRDGGFKLIDSRVPNQTRLFRVADGQETEVRAADHERETRALREVLSSFRSLVPHEPKSDNAPVDKATEERLRALGYL